MPDPVTAAISGGLAVGGQIIGGIGESKALKSQARAADAATQAQLDMYYQSRADLAPWREAGGEALNSLMGYIRDPSQVTTMPGYQFGLGEGVKALERGASARGRQLSGAQGNALQRFGQDYARGQFLNYLSPYSQVAGLGQTSAGQTAQLGGQYGPQIANSLMAGGAARGARSAVPYGVAGGLMDWGGNQLMNYGMLNAMGPQNTFWWK